MLENIVGDPTDPKGTLQPNLHLEIGSGDHYKPLFCPEFDCIINLPAGIDRTNPLAIWSLFFTPKCLQNIVQNTNKKGRSWLGPEHQGDYDRQWKDIDMSDLYIFFAILIYMALYIENDTKDYWSQARDDSPTHLPVIRHIGQNRWHNIHYAFHISDPTIPGKTTVFQKVEPLNSHIWEASRQYWIPGRDLAVDECMERFSG